MYTDSYTKIKEAIEEALACKASFPEIQERKTMYKITKHFEENTKGRDFVVGDLHGTHSLFLSELLAVDFDFEIDRCFSVGDLIDRGPESVKCLELLNKPWFHAVIGNHEDLLMDDMNYSCWMMNGGNWINSCEPNDIYRFRDLVRDNMTLTLSVDTPWGKCGMVHAESALDFNENDIRTSNINMWARQHIKHQQDAPTIKNIDRLVVGHTPLKKVVRFTNHVYIDTGACFGDGFLTLMPMQDVFKSITQQASKPKEAVLDDNF